MMDFNSSVSQALAMAFEMASIRSSSMDFAGLDLVAVGRLNGHLLKIFMHANVSHVGCYFQGS